MNFDKVFLTGGCSYTLPLDYLQYKIDYYNTRELTHTLINHIGVPSTSIKYLKNSIITFVDYFLKNGIKNQNIYVVGDLTQIGRRNYKFNKNEQKYVLNLLDKIEDWKPDLSVGELKFKKYPYGFYELGDDIYSSLVADQNFYNELPSDIKKRLFTFYDYHNNLSMEELAEDYFSDLFILQEYLKKNKIEYTFYFMSNIIEGWDSEYITHLYNDFFGKYQVPDLKNTYNIKNISNQVNSLFNLIDFDNIICYSTETQKFGGIDEYAINNYQPTDFAGRENLEIKDYYGPHFTFFGQHPLENVQIDFEEKFIYPRMENFIKKHYKNHKNLL